MTFKPLEIYKESHIDTAISSSLLGISNGFCISINKNRFWEINSPFWRCIGNMESQPLNHQRSPYRILTNTKGNRFKGAGSGKNDQNQM